MSLMISPVRDGHGRIVAAAKTARDITARKAGEAERADRHRRLGLLVSASASLLTATESAAVAAVTVGIAQQLLEADGFAVWVSDRDGRGWHVLNARPPSR